mmetsp:Transcript_10495/g.15771  ORF Transcript_10495/g.15771 Transcript_10495/m.15771 type:complete len:103 (-) Transcript_10495:464-772(-)
MESLVGLITKYILLQSAQQCLLDHSWPRDPCDRTPFHRTNHPNQHLYSPKKKRKHTSCELKEDDGDTHYQIQKTNKKKTMRTYYSLSPPNSSFFLWVRIFLV